MASSRRWNRASWGRFGAGFEGGLGLGATALPAYYGRLARTSGMGARSLARTFWQDMTSSPFGLGMLSGTVATAGALAIGVPMALGGAYDLVTGRRRSRLSGFTTMAAGAAIAGLPFYGPSLYRWASPQVMPFVRNAWNWLRG